MIMRVWLSALGLLLLCSSYSNAYDQQYQIGDTGPNGGTVTNVVVDSVLSDTTTDIIGGFQETTEIWQYTETVTEAVNSTQVTKTFVEVEREVLTTTTTDNLLCTNGSCEVLGGLTGGVQAAGDDGFVFSYQGGTVSGTVDLIDSMTQNEFNKGFEVNSSVDTFTCLNTISSNTSCEDIGNPTADTLKLTITVTDGLESYTNVTTHSINWAPTTGLQTVYGYLAVPENNLQDYATATFSIYGIDDGYWGGYYGPYVTNPDMSFTYDAVSLVIDIVEQEVINTITDYVTTDLLTTITLEDSIYVGDPTTDTPITEIDVVDTTDGPEINSITQTGPDLFEVEIEFEMPGGNTVTEVVEVELAALEIEPLGELEPMDGGMGEPMQAENDASPEPMEGSNEQDKGPKSVSATDTDESSEEISVQKSDSKDKPTKKSTASNSKRRDRGSSAAAYSSLMDAVRLTLINQQQAIALNEYKQTQLPDVPFYAETQMDGGNVVDHPYGRWATGASDYLWNKMVDEQWQK